RDSGEAWRFTANFRLGRHWQEIGDFVRAHAAYLEAKALSKGKHRATLYNLAVVAIRLGLYDEAKATLKELAALDGLPMEPQDARSPRPALYPLVYQRALIEEYRGDYDIARQWSEPLARDALKDEGPVPLALRLPALTLHAGVLVELDH